MFDVISREEAVEVDCDRCHTRGGVPVGSLVRWGGENLWRSRDATDIVLLHLTREDLGEEVRLRTTVDSSGREVRGFDGVSLDAGCCWGSEALLQC